VVANAIEAAIAPCLASFRKLRKLFRDLENSIYVLKKKRPVVVFL